MKIAGIVGTNADFSYNRRRLEFIQEKFSAMAEIEIVEVNDLPLFSKDYFDGSDELSPEESYNVNRFKYRIEEADGIIWSCPEYDHTIPAALKNAIEWLAFQEHILDDKPSMVIGASYGRQGSAFAQEQLRQILAAPSVAALTLPACEVEISFVADKFKTGTLRDEADIARITQALTKFVKFSFLNQKDFYRRLQDRDWKKLRRSYDENYRQ